MKTDRNIVEMIDILRGNKKDQSIEIATIQSTQPLSLKMYDMVIKRNIYINANVTFKSGDTVVVFRNSISFYVLEKVVKRV